MSIQETMPVEEENNETPDLQQKNEKNIESKEEVNDEEQKDEQKSESVEDGKGDGKAEEANSASMESSGDRKIDPKDWPLRDIKEPGDNDVLFGRGGGTNHAKGNKKYRKMVEDRKLQYVNSKRLDKPLVALEIIKLWRAQDPPGRFLKLDSNGTWSDVGDKKAREKTSQALREKAPLIRKQQEEERTVKEDGQDSEDEKEQSTKTTRFAEGTNTESKGGVKKAVLARDHSLGREYLQAGETVNLEGFSWRDPFQSGSQGKPQPTSQPPPPGEYPVQRISRGGMAMPPPPNYRVPSGGPAPPMPGPPPPAYFHRTATDEYRQSYPSAPIMPGYTGYGPSQRSGSWTHSPAHAMPPLREHSLSQNPLRNASASHAAPLNAFESGRSGSGYWADSAVHRPTAPPAQQPYGGHYREGSGGYRSQPPIEYSHNRGYNPSMQPPPPVNISPPYAVDPAIAKTWSGQSDEDISKMYDKDFRSRERPIHHNGTDQMNTTFEDDQDQSKLPRPQIAKRMTSNQNETVETKPDLCGPSVKRAALNRDQSAVSNRLKATHLPEYYTKNGKFDSEHEMKLLSDNLEQSTLDNAKRPEQRSMHSTQRTSSIDEIAMDLMVKPAAITDSSRSSTIEALALDDLDTDPVLKQSGTGAMPKPSALTTANRMTTMEACFADLEAAKPLSLSGTDRISTTDYLNIGDEPLTELDIDRIYEKDE